MDKHPPHPHIPYRAIHVHPGWNILNIKSGVFGPIDEVLVKKGFKTMTVSLFGANKGAVITKIVVSNEFSDKKLFGPLFTPK